MQSFGRALYGVLAELYAKLLAEPLVELHIELCTELLAEPLVKLYAELRVELLVEPLVELHACWNYKVIRSQRRCLKGLFNNRDDADDEY